MADGGHTVYLFSANCNSNFFFHLILGVSFYYKASKETELKTRLTVLEQNNGDKTEINRLFGEIEELKTQDKDTVLYPELGTEKELNWQRIAVRFLRDR